MASKTLFGTFIVYGGDECPPSVHVLSTTEVDILWTRQGLATTRNGMMQALRMTFDVAGAEYALPAWNVDGMTEMALTYVGVHQQLIRGLCAAAALGRLLGDGGDKVTQQQAPRPRKPAPAARVSAFDQLQQAAS